MKAVRGDKLGEAAKRDVLAAYVHRHLSGQDDETWLREHAFYVRKDGRLSRAHRYAEPACLADGE